MSFVSGFPVGGFVFPFVGSCVDWVGGFAFLCFFVFYVVVVWSVSFGIEGKCGVSWGGAGSVCGWREWLWGWCRLSRVGWVGGGVFVVEALAVGGIVFCGGEVHTFYYLVKFVLIVRDCGGVVVVGTYSCFVNSYFGVIGVCSRGGEMEGYVSVFIKGVEKFPHLCGEGDHAL